MTKRKLLGCIIIGAIMSLGFTTTVFAAEEDIIMEKDFETGAVRQLTLSMEESGDELMIEPSFGEEGVSAVPYSVIGSDNRVRETETKRAPYRWVAYVEATWRNKSSEVTKKGTAFMISDYSALTAGHMIYDKGMGGYADDIAIWPGMNAGTKPFSGSHARNGYVPKAYITSINKNNFDCGIINLRSPLGRRVGHFGIRSQTATYNGTNMYILGYPNESSKLKQLWKMKGPIVSTNNYKLTYKIDTSNGQSGSPIIRLYNGKWFAVGVHTSGPTDPSSPNAVNSGIKFNAYMFNFIRQFRKN